MNKLIIVLTMCLAFTAQAEDASDEDIYKLCATVSETAKRMMEYRQKGVSVVLVMDNMTSKIGKALAINAYQERVWRTEDYKQRAINEFATEYYLECIKTYKD